jgi:hypothetical protein
VVRDARWVRWLASWLEQRPRRCRRVVRRACWSGTEALAAERCRDGSQVVSVGVGLLILDSGQEVDSSQRPCCYLVGG